jgi:hypothetical protein
VSSLAVTFVTAVPAKFTITRSLSLRDVRTNAAVLGSLVAAMERLPLDRATCAFLR